MSNNTEIYNTYNNELELLDECERKIIDNEKLYTQFVEDIEEMYKISDMGFKINIQYHFNNFCDFLNQLLSEYKEKLYPNIQAYEKFDKYYKKIMYQYHDLYVIKRIDKTLELIKTHKLYQSYTDDIIFYINTRYNDINRSKDILHILDRLFMCAYMSKNDDATRYIVNAHTSYINNHKL